MATRFPYFQYVSALRSQIVTLNIGTPYVFESAEQLVTDFFAEVDKVLRKIQ